jgi:hypothetical protein
MKQQTGRYTQHGIAVKRYLTMLAVQTPGTLFSAMAMQPFVSVPRSRWFCWVRGAPSLLVSSVALDGEVLPISAIEGDQLGHHGGMRELEADEQTPIDSAAYGKTLTVSRDIFASYMSW